MKLKSPYKSCSKLTNIRAERRERQRHAFRSIENWKKGQSCKQPSIGNNVNRIATPGSWTGRG